MRKADDVEHNSGAAAPKTPRESLAAGPIKARAFLRWVGGKQFLLRPLLRYFPDQASVAKYHEPFAGAANLFFALEPQSAVISDLNRHLIETYQQVRDNHSQISRYLREHQEQDCENYYYRVRDRYNNSKAGPAQAARFIYLNRTCFNGVFRVNTKGQFNVPYGFKSSPRFPSTKDLAAASKALARAALRHDDFSRALQRVGAGDFAYVDPPYPPLNGTSFFTHYTSGRFGTEDQTRLAESLKDVHRRGGRFLLTNADLPLIRDLYGNFRISELSVTRFVSCKGVRHKVGELVITNYDMPKSLRERDVDAD